MSRCFAALAATLCLVLFASSAHGWWCEGHMLVAEIARRHLKPDVAKKVETIISEMSAKGPYPQSPNMVDAACWSDDLKSFGLRAMNGWHYILQRYNPTNITIKKSPVDKMNVVTVIESLVKTLKSKKRAPVSVIGFALAHLIHFYGDVHQPLHATTMYSAAYPKGDVGGNLVKVYYKKKKMNLHAVWDSICQGPSDDPPRPLSKEDSASIVKYADFLEKTYSFTDEQKANTEPAVFANESFQIGQQTGHKGITNGMTLSDDYLQKCKSSAESRVAIAGYRLATELNNIFSGESYKLEDLTESDSAYRPGSIFGVLDFARNAKKMLFRAYG